MSDPLAGLAELLRNRNRVDAEIARLIVRPAIRGHLGEFIASHVFRIKLEDSASRKAWDGRFTTGALAGRTVNVKWYAIQENCLDITPESLPDFYLVLAGPQGRAGSSRGGHQPLVLESVYLFEAEPLVQVLKARGTRIWNPTSVPKKHWEAAEVYPRSMNGTLVLTPEQRALLELFSTGRIQETKKPTKP